MSEEQQTNDATQTSGNVPVGPDYAEFEIGQDKVPWFLWVFFSLIISWASISWMKLFGY